MIIKKYKRTLYRNMLNTVDNSEELINRLYITSTHIKRSLSCILHYVRLAIDECLEFSDLGFISIKPNTFLDFPEEISLRLLTYSIMCIGQKKYKPRYNKLSKIFYKILNNEFNNAQTLSNCKIKKSQDNTISITREISTIKDLVINRSSDTLIEWDNRFKVRVTNPNNYDIILSRLNNKHIPEHLKKLNRDAVRCLPVLIYKNKIIAYPLQKYNTDDYINKTAPCISIEEVLVKQNLTNLTYSEFISRELLL
ncbi:MAG: hypothetical protein ACTJLM_02370 [Ehrlichia sp.]